MSTTVTHPDPDDWDSFAEKHNGHFLQISRWGMLKQATANWDYEIVALEQHGQLVAGALVLYWRAPFGLGTVAYVPRGPVVDWKNDALVTELLSAIDTVAQRHRTVVLKIEPDAADSPAMRERLKRLGLKKSAHTIQPASTTIVDTSGTEETILARMNQGNRRKIRMASKRGVTVRHGKAEDVASFYALMEITGRRDGIGIRDHEYYRKAFDLLGPHHATLLLASYQSRDLGAIMALALGKRAWYLYGASSNEERERMPNYAVQWEAIRWARERGCTEYDMWGIPDVDEATLEAQFQHRQDGMWGLYGFKRGFGGSIWRAVGAWDRPYKPLLYAGYKTAAALRDWYRDIRHIATTP